MARSCALVSAAAGFLVGCGSNPTESTTDTGLLRVLSIEEAPLSAFQVEQLHCQIGMNANVFLPDCIAFGDYSLRVEGNTYHMELHGARVACSGFSGDTAWGLCLPGGLGQLPPAPPPLPPGDYVVEVNGVSGTFTIP